MMHALPVPIPNAPTFDRFPLLNSGDFDQVRHEISRLFCEHRLDLARGQKRLDTRVYFRPGTHIGCGRMQYGATVDIDPGQLDDFYLLQMPLRGAETVVLGHVAWQSTPRLASIVSPGVRFRMRHEDGAEKLFLRIERIAIEQQFQQLHGHASRQRLTFAPTIDFATATGRNLSQLLYWYCQEASDGTLLDQPLIAAQAEETLLLTLLHQLPGNPASAQAPSAVSVAPRFVRHAEDYIQAHAHLPLTATLIAAQVGVSTRSLFAGFRRYRNTTPLQYLREIRLEHTHRELSQATRTDCRVTDIALRWGFGHLGQFALLYRKRYGERPSSTLRRRLDAQTP